MTHLSASKLTFKDSWSALSEADQLAEQVAALNIVAACGGEVKAQYLLTTDECLFSVVEYPNEDAALKSAAAIGQRGFFVLSTQRAVTLDQYLSMADEIRTLAGK
jgi:uncharacterized protein with GYD domain